MKVRSAWLVATCVASAVAAHTHDGHLRHDSAREPVQTKPLFSSDGTTVPPAGEPATAASKLEGWVQPVCAVTVVLLAIAIYVLYDSRTRNGGEDELAKHTKSLPEDTYGFAVASLIRDIARISEGSRNKNLRMSRIASSLLVVFINVGLQVVLMYYIKRFVTAKWVHDIRVDYDEYELHMYGDEPGHQTLTVNGKHRGVEEFFDPSKFATLDEDLKERVCNIPFSQPGFFLAVLFIWALTCISEIRQCLSLFKALVINMDTIPSMTTSLSWAKESFDGKDAEMIVNGLTRQVKCLLTFAVILPRFIITLVLTWLGSRFLGATNDFCDMVLNAIALEFILLLKDLLWTTIVPERNKKETTLTELFPSSPSEPSNYWSFHGTFMWIFVALGWAVYYMLSFQTVLPGYNWDVNAVCAPWLRERLQV